jgi:hypothetical protein
MVKLILFTHPQQHLVFSYYVTIALTYILSQIELETKGYGVTKRKGKIKKTSLMAYESI